MPAPSNLPTLTRVRGVRVGHATNPSGSSGVTVVRFAHAAPTVVSVLGGASATYDTGSLALDATFGRRWALFLAGGSLFGLDAARGIRDRLLADGDGVPVFGHSQRLVPIAGAALFDLARNAGTRPDYAELGERAAAGASRRPVAAGGVGAGAGATVAKYRGRRYARPGGIGSVAQRVPGLGWIGAIAAVNSVGAIWDPAANSWAAVARDRDGRSLLPILSPGSRRKRPSERGTTLAILVMEASLDRPSLQRVTSIAAAGLARCVIPIFTATDGDVLFASSTEMLRPAAAQTRPMEVADELGAVAADLIGRAVVHAVDGRAPERTG